ncbi:MAG TPA: DUF2911 domain-containing protein [Ferruginibacter sp.]|nr:DUF2911 domain-containing protein [Ferruginibacter sp.]HPH93179.1 DUF2911 domain-containing protein [Ferruginibacter sp.]
MKKLCSLVFAAVLLTSIEAQVKMPAPSPTQTVKQDFAMGSIEIVYSRPSSKGRKVFGDLVPMRKLWRTGANQPTKITFSEAVELGGKKVEAGSYALYSIPSDESWEIILNKGLSNWGIDGYKETEDVVRFKVMPAKTKNMVETFTIQFANIKPESCEIQIQWEQTTVSIPVTANIKDKLKAQIEDALKNAEKKPYWEAAQFYNEFDKNLPKALENVTKAIEGYPKGYWMIVYKAKIQKEMGDIAGALESSKKSMELAKEEGNEDYVKINKDLQKSLNE